MNSDWADATFKELVETAWTTALKWQDTYMDQTTPMGIKDQQRAELTAKRSAIIAELERRSTALRDAARVPEGYVRTADGVDRKVLGTLPITADGCVPGLGASVSWPGYGEEYVYDGHVRYSLVWAASIPVESSTPVRDCYSTREAAEAALAQPTPARGEGE